MIHVDEVHDYVYVSMLSIALTVSTESSMYKHQETYITKNISTYTRRQVTTTSSYMSIDVCLICVDK